MKLVLDTGALIALERNDRAIWRRYKEASSTGVAIVTHGGIVGQAWRGKGPRHALLSRALLAIDVRPLDAKLGRAAGELLAKTGGRDVIDAALVLLAEDGDDIATSDANDLLPLAEALDRAVELIET